ncbi:hypothetical protein ASF74_21090 [Arthrobacter sp. Leaf145]|nr:hypothetical protein ASF74_21090 [Arthrobacter sp. Leaf145]
MQSGNAQPPSRAVMALRMWGGKIRVVRPMSSIWESAGRVQSGNAQPPSRAVMALRMWGGKIRVVRPMSSIWESAPSRTGRMSASQAILRMVLGWIGPVKVAVPVLTVFRGRG